MAKKSLLLVDADPRSLRVLEVSLRKAGYSVATCRDAGDALETVQLSAPDLILSDTRLPGMNGFELVGALRQQEEHRSVPFMFLSSDSSVESKIRGLELGVEDYLTKPIYIKEIITRINLTLQRQERDGLARRTSISKTRFTGSLGDMGLVDLLQTIDISRKSGVLELTDTPLIGTISFREGQLIDAEHAGLSAEAAIYRLLLWSDGEFEIDFRPVRAEQRIQSSTQAILMEGMRRVDEWGRLLEQIPALDSVFEVSETELVERLAEIPDEINSILRHMDGRHSLMEVVDAAGQDDLETLTAITKLYFEGIIVPTGRTTDPADMVVGEAAAAPTDAGAEAVVPRAPTEPPADRANANVSFAPADTDVPGRAGVDAPLEGQIEPVLADPAIGIEAASVSEPLVSEPDRSGGTSTFSLEANDTLIDTPLNQAEEDGERMARKRRRRRGKRGQQKEAAQPEAVEAAQPEAVEAASNVIQFPAKARNGATSKQMAVNGGVTVDDEIDAAIDSARADTTETRVRDSGEPDELAEATPDEGDSEAPAEVADESAAGQTGASAKAPEPETEAPVDPAAGHDDDAAATAEDGGEDAAEPAGAPEPVEEPAAKAESPGSSSSESKPSRSRKRKKGRDKKRRSRASAEAAEKKRSAAEKTNDKPSDRSASRRKKVSTTSSAEIRAVTSTGEHREVAQGFFSTKAKVEEETWSDLSATALPLSDGAKRAKYATFGIVVAGLLGIGGFLFYQNVMMPQPEALVGATRPVDIEDLNLPTDPEAHASSNGDRASQEHPRPEEHPSLAGSDEEPTAEERAGEPAAEEPAAEEPAAEEPAAEEPAAEEPAAEEPAAEEPAAEEPAAEEPAAEEPAAEEPAAPGAADPEGAQEFARQAMRALNRARNSEAAELAARAVAADPTNAQGWLVLGAARQELGDRSGAREAYQSCVARGTGRYRRDCRQML